MTGGVLRSLTTLMDGTEHDHMIVPNYSGCTNFKVGGAPFTVRSTPDFENTNGMEQNTIT